MGGSSTLNCVGGLFSPKGAMELKEITATTLLVVFNDNHKSCSLQICEYKYFPINIWVLDWLYGSVNCVMRFCKKAYWNFITWMDVLLVLLAWNYCLLLYSVWNKCSYFKCYIRVMFFNFQNDHILNVIFALCSFMFKKFCFSLCRIKKDML